MLARLRKWARGIKTDAVALWIAAGDPRTPGHAKIVAALVAAYAVSPLDLIPDFIPVLGYLDDLILLPLGIKLALSLIPGPLMAEFRAEARRHEQPSSRAAAAVIVAIWIAAAAILLWFFWPDRAV